MEHKLINTNYHINNREDLINISYHMVKNGNPDSELIKFLDAFLFGHEVSIDKRKKEMHDDYYYIGYNFAINIFLAYVCGNNAMAKS